MKFRRPCYVVRSPRGPDDGSLLNGDVVLEWSRSRVEHASGKENHFHPIWLAPKFRAPRILGRLACRNRTPLLVPNTASHPRPDESSR